MALWQKDYFIVPEHALRVFYGTIPPCISEDDFNEWGWWQGAPVPDKQEIEAILPVYKKLDGMTLYGSDQGNRLHLIYDNNGSIEQILVRVDLSGEHRSFVEAIVGLAQKRQWVFVSTTGQVLLPEYEAITNNLAASDA